MLLNGITALQEGEMKNFLMILLGALACLLITDDFVLQPLAPPDSNAAYAMGHRDHRQHGWPTRPTEPGGPPHAVPEPSAQNLVAAGASGIATYHYYQHRKKKN